MQPAACASWEALSTCERAQDFGAESPVFQRPIEQVPLSEPPTSVKPRLSPQPCPRQWYSLWGTFPTCPAQHWHVGNVPHKLYHYPVRPFLDAIADVC